MAIRIEIKNNNIVPVDIKVYRSDTEIDRQNLPQPIVELSQAMGDPIVINDTTAVQDKFYYYVFQTIGAKDQQLSRNFYLQATETRGIGKSKILVGDANLGFMDLVPTDQLVSAADLLVALGTPVSAFNPPNNAFIANWVKYVRKNKIYYVPNIPLAWAMTRAQMVFYGLDKPKQIQLSGRTYNVRLPTMYDENTTVKLPSNSTIDMDTTDNLARVCEFNDLYYPLFNATPIGMKLPNIINQTPQALGLLSYPFIIGQEQSAVETQWVSRGTNTAGRIALTQLRTTAASTSGLYWPLLELVEN